jgi:hypothetical protein
VSEFDNISSYYCGKWKEIFVEQNICVTSLCYCTFSLFFPVMCFIPPFFFVLPELIISIIEQHDEFYGKRTFLVEWRRVFMLAP